MPTEAEVNSWRKYHRLSVRALPVAIICTGVLVAVLFGLSFLVPIPLWLAVLLVGVSAFSVLGDAINIIYLRGRLREAEHRER